MVPTQDVKIFDLYQENIWHLEPKYLFDCTNLSFPKQK